MPLLCFLALGISCTRQQQSIDSQAHVALPERPAALSESEAAEIGVLPSARIRSSALLAHRLRRRLLPEDAMIGPLADSQRTVASERAAVDAAEKLLTAVHHGDLHGAPLSRQGLIHVAASINYYLRRGLALVSFRLGMVERSGDTAFLRARLTGPLGSIPAELYLIRANGRWLIDDLQTDWAALQHSQPVPDPIPMSRSPGWVYF